MTTTKSDGPPGQRHLSAGGLIALLSGASLSVMSAMTVNVAIPSIQKEFSASPPTIAAIVAYYGLAHGVMLITGGRLGDLYGRRRMFVTGLAAFSVASLLCGLATSIPMLVGARIAQGVAAAIMFPQVLSIIRVAMPDERERSRALAAFGVVLGLAGVAGPLIGGALIATDLWGTSSWRLVFLINLPIGVTAGFTAARLIPETRSADALLLDVQGAFLCATGLGLVLYPLIEVRHAGWSAVTIAAMLAAVPVLATFVFDQHRKARRQGSPLVDPSLFIVSSFSSGVVIAFLFHATIIATYFILSLMLQAGLKYSALDAALIISPAGISFLAASFIGHRLLTRFGTFTVLLLGSVISTAGYTACGGNAITQLTADGWPLVSALITTGFGQGLFLPPLLGAVLASTPKEQAGSASGILTTAQQVGGAFGVAIAGLIYFHAGHDALYTQDHMHGFAWTMALQVATALLVLVLLPMLFRRRPQTASHRSPKETAQ